MATTMSDNDLGACVRGCTTARRHVTDCEDQDNCKGCWPREAKHGLLCYGCHVRLLDWLTNAPGQYVLLATTAMPSMSQELHNDADSMRSATDGAPSPLNIAAVSNMTDLTDILFAWVEMLAEQYQMSGPARIDTTDGRDNPGAELNPRWSAYAGESVWCDPPARFEIHAACLWLRAQMERLESCPGIGDLWNELAEVMSQGHALAPWREQATRVKGIECPECHAFSLIQYGGDEHITCQRCNALVSPGRYAIWTRMLEAAREQVGA